ncbi:uncharacterized protein LOC34618515 [Cyclospora cayetanensis]|uniref:Uncharacterized protein LOC34618515 n=1 Tax=Cyclospora cayetanensis TaxID=88456 RepID=A0A6P6RXR5_9EIME|nr:uncharacterized protein LOC34618515 [Cyclospora cayetanensis]
MQDHEQTSHAAAEAFLAGADLDDFLFVLLDSLHPSFPGDTAAVSAAGVAPSELTEDAGATGQCHTQASASEGPPLLAVLRESWRPAKLLYDILEPPDGEAATAVAKAESEHQQQQKGEVEDLALRNLEVELSCPVAWGVSAEFLAEKPVYASCLSAGASLLSYAESEPERVLLAIKAFLEVHPAAKDHQVALLLLLRLLVFRWALYHHLKLHKRVEYSLKRPSVDAGETPGLFDYADAASNASEKPVTGTATSDLATPVAGCLSAIIAFAIQEASALADGDERKELLVEVLQILACCVPHIVISKLLKAVKKAVLPSSGGPNMTAHDTTTAGAVCNSSLILLEKILFSSGWPAISVSLTKQVFVVLLQAVLLPLQPEEPALALQQQQKSLSLPIRWSISLRAAEALSAFASVAAIGNCRSLLMTLEPQRQDTKSDNEPKAVELQSAQEDGLAAAATAAAEAARREGTRPPGGEGGCGIEYLPLMAAAAERLAYILLPRMLLARAPSGVVTALLRAATMLLLLPIHLSTPLMLRSREDEQSGMVRHDPVLLLLQLLLLHISSEISGIPAADLLQDDPHRSYTAAPASVQDQHTALKKQQQQLLEQGGLETAAAAAAAAAGSPATDEGDVHQGAAAYRQRLLLHEKTVATQQLEETVYRGDNHTGSVNNSDTGFGDGVKLEGPRAAAFFTHVATSLSHLAEVLSEGEYHWRIAQRAAEMQTVLLLLLLHTSRRCLTPRDPLRDSLADETLKTLVLPIVAAAVSSLSAVQMQHDAKTSELPAAANGRNALMQPCHPALARLTAVSAIAAPPPAAAAVAAACWSGAKAPPYLQEVGWVVHAVNKAASTGDPMHGLHASVCWCFPSSSPVDSLMKSSSGTLADKFSNMQLMLRAARQQAQPLTDADTVRFVTDGIARLLGSPVRCRGGLAMAALHATTDALAAAGSALHRLRVQRIEPQQQQQLMAIQCAALVFIGRTAETQRIDCPPPQLALSPWQLPSRPCHCVPQGEPVVSLRLPQSGEVQQQRESVDSQLEDAQYQVAERRRMRCETAARLVTSIFTLANRRCLSPAQAAALLSVCRSLAESRLLQAAALFLAVEAEEQQPAPRPSESASTSQQQQQETNGSSSALSTDTEVQAHIDFKLPLLRPAEAALGWSTVRLIEPNDSSSTSDEELFPTRRLPSLRRRRQMIKRDAPSVPPTSNPLGLNASEVDSTSFSTGGTGSGTAAEEKQRAATLQQMPRATTAAATGGAAWTEHPPVAVCGIFMFVLRLLCIAPADGEGDAAADFTHWTMRETLQLEVKPTELPRAASPAAILRDAATHVLFDAFACKTPVPQSQAGALCQLLLHAADIHSEGGALAIAALNAISKLIRSVLPSNMMQQQQDAFVSEGSMLNVPLASSASQQQQHPHQDEQQPNDQQKSRLSKMETSLEPSYADKAELFVSFLVKSLKEHADGAFTLFSEGWVGALCELLLLLHRGLLSVYGGSETQQLFVSCCLLRSFAAAAAAVQKEAEITGNGDLQVHSRASTSLSLVMQDASRISTAATAPAAARSALQQQQQQRALAALQFLGVLARSFPSLSVQKNLVRVLLGCGSAAAEAQVDGLSEEAEGPPALWLLLSSTSEASVRGVRAGPGIIESLLMLSKAPGERERLADLPGGSSSSSVEGDWPEGVEAVSGSAQLPAAAAAVVTGVSSWGSFAGMEAPKGRRRKRFAASAEAAAANAASARYCQAERLRRVVSWLGSSSGAFWLQDSIQPLTMFAADGRASLRPLPKEGASVFLLQEQRATARAVALAAGSSTSNFASALSLLQSLGTPPMQRRPFSGFPFFGSSGSKQQAEGGRVLLLLCRTALAASPPPELFDFSLPCLLSATAAAAAAADALSSNSEVTALLAAAAAAAPATGSARPLGTWLFGGSSGSLAASYGGLMQQAKDSMLGVFYNEADAVQLIEKTEAFLAAAEATTSAAATHQKPCAFFLFVSLMLSLVLALQKETDRALALTLAAALHSMGKRCKMAALDLMRAASVYDSPALLMLSTQWVEAHCGISLRCSSRVVEAAEETVASAGAAAQSSGSKSLSSEYPHRGGTRWGVEGQAELLQGPPLLPRIFRENLDGTSSSRKDGGDVDASTSQEELLQAAAVIGSAIGRGVELAICALLPYCLHCRSLTAMPVSSLKATSAQLKEAASAWETGASLILPGPLSAVEAALGLTNGSRAAVIGSLPTGESKLRPLSVAAFNCIAEMLPVRLQTSDRHREQHDLLLQLERVSGEELQIHKGLCCMVLVASLHVLRNQVPAATTAYARTVYVRAISAAQTLARAPTRRHFYSLPSGFSGNLEASSESQERKASDASGSFLGERTKQLPHHRGEGQQQQTSGVSAAALAAGDSQEPLESLRSLRVSSFPGSSSAGTGARTDVQQLLVDTKNAVQDGLVLELCLDTLSAADKEFEALATSATEALLALSRHSSSWQTTALLLQALLFKLCNSSIPFVRWRGLRAVQLIVSAALPLLDEPSEGDDSSRVRSTSSSSSSSGEDLQLWLQLLLLLFPKGGDSCLQLSVLAMQSFDLLVAKAARGTAAARVVADATTDVSAPAASANTISQGGSLLLEQHEPLFEKPSILTDAKGTSSNSQRRLQSQDFGRVAEVRRLLYPGGMQDKLVKRQQQLLQRRQELLLLLLRPHIEMNQVAAKRAISMLLMQLAESEGPAALVSMRCLTELLCPLPHAVAANTHLHQQAQTQGDDKQDPPLQHSQASLELERSSSSSNILHRPAIIRRVSRAFFAVFPIRRTRMGTRRACLQRLRHRLASVATASGPIDSDDAIAAAAAAAVAAPVLGMPGARWASRETKQGSMQDNEKETDGSSQADAGSDFCVAALEYEAQTFWTQRLQQEEAQLEESAAEYLFRLALLDFDAVLSPLTAYTQPSSADLSKMSSASAGPAASSLISPAPSPVSTGFREGEESFVSAGGMAVQRDATAVWNLKGLTASLLSLEQFEDMAAVIQWRGSCCFYSTNCIHRLFASCISRDKSLAAKLISHVTGVCNKLAATAPAAGETGALAAEDQRALVAAAAQAQHQATLLLLLLLQHEQQHQHKHQKPSSLGRMLQRHTAPLLGTALLRLGMAHAATSLSGSQQQQRLSPHAESARLQILGSNDELISWDSLKAQVEGSAASSSKENISPRKATQLISSPVAAAAELLVALADVTGLRQALKALDGCNFLARATNPSDCIGAIHDATLSSAIAAMQGAAAALHVVNLVPSAGLTDARATGNESVSSKQQQQQQPRSPEYTADARVAANAGTSMPHRHPKQHFCGTWTAFVPSKAFPDITTNGLLAAGARVQSASASRSPCTGQGMLLLPAKSMERLLETATDAAVDAAAMTLDDIQPHLLRLEVLVSTGKTAPPDASAAAEAVSESLLAADALHSLRSALACLQILTHLWVGLHRTAAEGGFSPAAAAACADAAAQDAENAQGTALPHASHAFGNESRALRVLEVFEVGFAVYPTLRCRPTGRQAHGGEDASREREGATGVAAAIAATAASAAFEATLQCIETPLLPLLFRALKHSAMLLQQAHGEEEPAAAATDPGKLCDTHFLKPREADELAFAALFHCGTTNPAVTQAAAECLLTLLPMLGLPKGRTSQRHLQCLQEALKKELEALGLIRPVLRIRANEPQQLPCACCCVLEQQPQEHAQGQYSSLNRKPRAVSGLLSAAECFFYSAALSGTRSESTGTTRIHGGTSLVARSMRLQRLLKPILRALLHADWHANLERTCCLCSLDDPDFFASEVKARGSCEGAQATSGSSGATNTPLDEGDGSRSLGGWNASEGNCGSRTEDPPNLVMHDLCYRACRRLCLRICHLLQCCRYYFPSRCSTVSAPPHPAIVLHKQQASARRKQRRVDWLFFGSLIGKDTQSEAKANDAPRKEGESSWRPPGGRASFSNLPGMNREVALRAIDGVGLIRTVAGFFGHNEEEEPAPEGQPSAEESENSDAESEMRETADVQKWQHMTFFLSNPPGPELPMEAGPINPHQPLQQQQQKKLQLFSESAPTAQKAADAPILSVSLDSVDLEDEVLVQLQQALEYFRRSPRALGSSGRLSSNTAAANMENGASSIRHSTKAEAIELEEERAVASVALMGLRHVGNAPSREQQQQQRPGEEHNTGVFFVGLGKRETEGADFSGFAAFPVSPKQEGLCHRCDLLIGCRVIETLQALSRRGERKSAKAEHVRQGHASELHMYTSCTGLAENYQRYRIASPWIDLIAVSRMKQASNYIAMRWKYSTSNLVHGTTPNVRKRASGHPSGTVCTPVFIEYGLAYFSRYLVPGFAVSVALLADLRNKTQSVTKIIEAGVARKHIEHLNTPPLLAVPDSGHHWFLAAAMRHFTDPSNHRFLLFVDSDFQKSGYPTVVRCLRNFLQYIFTEKYMEPTTNLLGDALSRQSTSSLLCSAIALACDASQFILYRQRLGFSAFDTHASILLPKSGTLKGLSITTLQTTCSGPAQCHDSVVCTLQLW